MKGIGINMHDRTYRLPIKAGAGNWKVIFLLIPYLMEFRVRVGIALAFLIVAKLANVLVPLVLKYIVDGLDVSQLTIAEGIKSGQILVVPFMLLLAYGVLRFSTVFFNELRDAVFGRVSEGTLSKIGVKLFRHLHELDLEFHLTRRTGGLSRDIERGVNGISFLLRAIVFSVIPIMIEVLMVVIIVAIFFDFWFSLITLSAVALYIAFSIVVTNWRTEFVRVANNKDSEANTLAIDSLLNYETVKYFNNEEYEAERYLGALRGREAAKVKSHLSLAYLNSGQALIIAIGVTLVMGLATQRVVEGVMTLGDLAMVNAYLIQVFIPLSVLGFIYREMKRALADVEAMFDLLALRPGIEDAEEAILLPEGSDGVEFKNVNFSYHEDRPILKNVSFTVNPGEKVAIVGPSGAGKSTISRLLFRFYDVNDGCISVGGEDIRNIQQQSLRKAIGIVPQDTVLFNDTLLVNLQYGRPSADREDIQKAAEVAELDKFIDSLPKKYETRVGERGLKISGGEKQRVAIARAILKEPKIYIFDEATSSLDSGTERAIVESLSELSKQVTTLVIAHRLSTIVDADKIILLDHGEIKEQGTHSELLAQKGAYSVLWEIQQNTAGV